MKIFSTSDIHGSSTIIRKLKIIASKADLILVAGDIGGRQGRDLFELGRNQADDIRFLDDMADEIYVEFGVPLFFILGNDDWTDHMSSNSHQLVKPTPFSQKGKEQSRITLVPFDFVSLTPFDTNREVNENKMSYELNRLTQDEGIIDKKAVILGHMPPYECGDLLYNGNRCGSKAIRKFITKHQPMVWFCGHIHEDNSASKIGETFIFNCACRDPYTLKGWLFDTVSKEYEKISI